MQTSQTSPESSSAYEMKRRDVNALEMSAGSRLWHTRRTPKSGGDKVEDEVDEKSPNSHLLHRANRSLLFNLGFKTTCHRRFPSAEFFYPSRDTFYNLTEKQTGTEKVVGVGVHASARQQLQQSSCQQFIKVSKNTIRVPK